MIEGSQTFKSCCLFYIYIYIYIIINYYSLIDHDGRESNITTRRRLYSTKKKKKTGRRLIGIYLVLYLLFLSCTYKLRTSPTRL